MKQRASDGRAGRGGGGVFGGVEAVARSAAGRLGGVDGRSSRGGGGVSRGEVPVQVPRA